MSHFESTTGQFIALLYQKMKERLYKKDKICRCEILMPRRFFRRIHIPGSHRQNRSPFTDTTFEYQTNTIPEWKDKSDVVFPAK